jgi:prepilin-type N-terminal cleavage/methylation domain-containing protein
MNDNGLTLVEMVTVMALIGILLGIGTLNFRRISVKYLIEGQTRSLSADLMELRLRAMYKKKSHAAKFSATTFETYSSLDESNNPQGLISRTNLKCAVVSTVTTLRFNAQGLTSDQGCICTEPFDNPGAIDSLVVTMTLVNIGKRPASGECTSDAITFK